MFRGRFEHRRFRKTLAILGAVTVGATLLAGVAQMGSASAAPKGCSNNASSHYFKDTGKVTPSTADDNKKTHHYYAAGKTAKKDAKVCGGGGSAGSFGNGGARPASDTSGEGGSPENLLPPDPKKKDGQGCKRFRNSKKVAYWQSSSTKKYRECNDQSAAPGAGGSTGGGEATVDGGFPVGVPAVSKEESVVRADAKRLYVTYFGDGKLTYEPRVLGVCVNGFKPDGGVCKAVDWTTFLNGFRAANSASVIAELDRAGTAVPESAKKAPAPAAAAAVAQPRYIDAPDPTNSKSCPGNRDFKSAVVDGERKNVCELK